MSVVSSTLGVTECEPTLVVLHGSRLLRTFSLPPAPASCHKCWDVFAIHGGSGKIVATGNDPAAAANDDPIDEPCLEEADQTYVTVRAVDASSGSAMRETVWARVMRGDTQLARSYRSGGEFEFHVQHSEWRSQRLQLEAWCPPYLPVEAVLPAGKQWITHTVKLRKAARFTADEFPPSRRFCLSVTVNSADSSYDAGASVVVTDHGSGVEVGRGFTDGDGTVDVAGGWVGDRSRYLAVSVSAHDSIETIGACVTTKVARPSHAMTVHLAATLRCQVLDATTGAALPATITVTRSGSSTLATFTCDSAGQGAATFRHDSWRTVALALDIACNGYLPRAHTLPAGSKIPPLQVVRLTKLPSSGHVPVDDLPEGRRFTLTAYVRSANANSCVPEARYVLTDTSTSLVVGSGTTDSGGKVTLAAGWVGSIDATFRLAVSKDGWEGCRDDMTVFQVPKNTRSYQVPMAVVLLQKPKPDQFCAVLTWGATPRDLDLYLVFPDDTSSYRKGTEHYEATFGKDYTSGYGPEVVTFTKQHTAAVSSPW